MSGAGEWREASVPVSAGMVHWPTDPPVEISRRESIDGGDLANLTYLRMSAHTGTHMDAPVHFLDHAEGIERFPLEVAVGPARVVEIDDPAAVTAPALERAGIADERPERLLLKTRNSARAWWEEGFDDAFVHIEPAAAELIAGAGVRLVGVDYLSVASGENAAATHRTLLGGGVWIVEGMKLDEVDPGSYELICLPLRLVGSDGAPARALLREIDEGSRG